MSAAVKEAWTANKTGFIKGTTLHYDMMNAPASCDDEPENIHGQVAVLTTETMHRLEEILASVKSPTKGIPPWDWDEWRSDSRKRYSDPMSPSVRASPELNQFRIEEITRKIMDYKKELARHRNFQKSIQAIVRAYPQEMTMPAIATTASAAITDITSDPENYNSMMREIHMALEDLNHTPKSPIV